MSGEPVGAADAGRTCPYCRFALKQGVEGRRCEVCGAVHHADCWADGAGCSVLGCAGGGSGEATVAVPPVPAAAPPAPAPAVAAPAVAPRGTGADRRMLVGLVIGLAVAGAGVGGYLVAHGGGDGEAQVRAAPATTSTSVSTTASAVKVQRSAMQEMAAAVALSQQGRTAVTERRYLDAIDNRERVLRRLDAIDTAHGRVAVSRRLLRAAMEASLASDRAYASGADPTGSDALATERKRAFVTEWNELAGQYHLATYTEAEI